MASLFAAKLAAAGRRIRMLASWEEGLQAIRTQGIRLADSAGMGRSYPVAISRDPDECKGSHHALVLVKAWQTERVGQQLRSCLNEDGLALTLQNGLGNLEILQAALGDDRAAAGVTTVGATLLAPGRVKPGGDGIIYLGTDRRLRPFADLFRMAGFSVEEVSDTSGLAWGKLVINAAINPLTALLRVPNGELLRRPAARMLMSAAASEAAGVARALGIHLPYSNAVQAVESVAKRTGENLSSMLRDVLRGAATEVDAINGEVVRGGERAGVPTPVNLTLWQLMKSLESPAQAFTNIAQDSAVRDRRKRRVSERPAIRPGVDLTK
jgi:2-dehydropantoate 2-reductase